MDVTFCILITDRPTVRTVIVDRDYPDVFGAFALLLREATDTRLIWDRRQDGERRRVVDVRRQTDRRRGASESWAERHWLVLDTDPATES